MYMIEFLIQTQNLKPTFFWGKTSVWNLWLRSYSSRKSWNSFWTFSPNSSLTSGGPATSIVMCLNSYFSNGTDFKSKNEMKIKPNISVCSLLWMNEWSKQTFENTSSDVCTAKDTFSYCSFTLYSKKCAEQTWTWFSNQMSVGYMRWGWDFIHYKLFNG
jgi:hypothetical protein